MPNNIQTVDALSNLQVVKTTQDGGLVHTPHHNAQLQVNGADVSSTNTVPVSLTGLPLPPNAATLSAQNTTNSALGTPTDGPAVSGSASHTSLLKGIAQLLSNTLSVAFSASNNVIGRVGLQVAGSDVSTSNRIPVDPSGVTQPISASALPLPSGAATLQAQTTQIATLGAVADNPAITGSVSHTSLLKGIAQLLSGTLSTTISAGSALIGKVSLQVAGADVSSGNAMPVYTATLPLPNNAATASNQTTLNALQQPILGVASYTLGQTTSPGRAVGVYCKGSTGEAVFAFADNSQITVPISSGYCEFGYAVTQVVSTTATSVTFTVLK